MQNASFRHMRHARNLTPIPTTKPRLLKPKPIPDTLLNIPQPLVITPVITNGPEPVITTPPVITNPDDNFSLASLSDDEFRTWYNEIMREKMRRWRKARKISL
jgi:hypothetical protein